MTIYDWVGFGTMHLDVWKLSMAVSMPQIQRSNPDFTPLRCLNTRIKSVSVFPLCIHCKCWAVISRLISNREYRTNLRQTSKWGPSSPSFSEYFDEQFFFNFFFFLFVLLLCFFFFSSFFFFFFFFFFDFPFYFSIKQLWKWINANLNE